MENFLAPQSNHSRRRSADVFLIRNPLPNTKARFAGSVRAFIARASCLAAVAPPMMVMVKGGRPPGTFSTGSCDADHSRASYCSGRTFWTIVSQLEPRLEFRTALNSPSNFRKERIKKLSPRRSRLHYADAR